MTTVNSNDLRTDNAKLLLNSISGPAPDFDAYTYMFAGRPIPWQDSTDISVDDSNPPVFKNNLRDYNNTHYQMMFLKRLYDNNAHIMISRNTWRSGQTYDMYRHDYSYKKSASSGATDLYDANFYVINSSFDVYVCLFNGTSPTNRYGVPSTVEPNGIDYQSFVTSDGYQWMYVYSVSESMQLHMTRNYIPIDSNYAYSPVAGEINTIVIESSGTNYTSHPSGVLDTLPYYYCKVVGDGSGCIARVTVKNQSISKIEVEEPGSGYTYATLDFSALNVFKTKEDLINQVNRLNPLGDDNFISTCIISPSGGWGSDLYRQLGGTTVGIFSQFDSDQSSDIVNTTAFRQLGILQNIEYSNPEFKNNLTLSAHYGIALNLIGSNDFVELETITQSITVNGIEKLARGIVIGWNKTTGVLRYIQDPELNLDTDGSLYEFSGNSEVTGLTSGARGSINSISNDLNDPDESNHYYDGLFFTDGYAQPEIKKHTGELIYLSNIQPIQRDPDQTESIGILIYY